MQEVHFDIDVLIQGQMRGPATPKTTSEGKEFLTFKAWALDKKGVRLSINCVAFARSVVDKVRGLEAGDSVVVSGQAAISSWVDSDGIERRGLDVTVHAAMTLYHAARHRAGEASEGQQGLHLANPPEGIGKTGH